MNLLAAKIREGQIEVPLEMIFESSGEVAASFRNMVSGRSLWSLLIATEPDLFEGLEDEAVLALLGNAYISLLPTTVWNLALDQAQREVEGQGEFIPTEWATFAPIPSRPGLGALLPEDVASRPRLSVFIPIANRIRALSLERDPELGMRASVQVSSGHCGYPDARGFCNPGTCGGCTARIREVGEWGLTCWCGH